MVTAFLIYISIGSLVWLVLDGCGVIEHSFVERPGASRRALVLASLMMIAAWPWFVVEWLKGLRRARR